MRLVVTLLVRDEIDIVEANVRHHLRCGASHVIVTDNRSIDGTRELLDALAAELPLTVIDEPSTGYEQSAWVTRMARLAATEHGADWVINADADELWWTADDDLVGALARTRDAFGVVEAPQLNFAPRHREQAPDDLVLRWRRWATRKAAHRAHADVVISQGNHKVMAPASRVDPDRSRITVLHLPHRSYAQFERKIVEGTRAYRNSPDLPEAAGAHWRALYEVWEEGGLPHHWDTQLQVSPPRALTELARRRLAVDLRVRRAIEASRPADPSR